MPVFCSFFIGARVLGARGVVYAAFALRGDTDVVGSWSKLRFVESNFIEGLRVITGVPFT